MNWSLSFVEFGSLTTSLLMEKVRGLQNLAYQLGLDEGRVLGLLFFAETYFFSETDHLKSELLFAGRFWAISCLDLYVLVCQFGLQEFLSLQQVGNVLTLVQGSYAP